MKTKYFSVPFSVSLLATTLSAAPFFLPVTYQGRLDETGMVANGNFELQVGLFNTASGGSPLQLLTNNITVSNGLFTTVLQLDGTQLQDANTDWLELGVRTNGSAAAFAILTPRQQLTYAPLAARADVAGIANDFPQGAVYSYHILDGSIEALDIDSGQVVKSVNGLKDAVTLAAGVGITITPAGNTLTISNTGWKLNGNAGTTAGTHFLGTTDNQAVELRVDNRRGIRIEPSSFDTVNFIAGWANNLVGAGVTGATIAGGGAGLTNQIDADFGVVAGGAGHLIAIEARYSVVSGGHINQIQTDASVATISGGTHNTIGSASVAAAIGGGEYNLIHSNSASATIGGGHVNVIEPSALAATIAGGWVNAIRSNAYYGTIGGGAGNILHQNSSSATISGGSGHSITAAPDATIAGGSSNLIQSNALRSVIGGGYFNTIQSDARSATIAGGNQNTIRANGWYGTIPGGDNNSATNYALAVGRRAKANHTGAFVWADSQDADFPSTNFNQMRIRASGGVDMVGGNTVEAFKYSGSRSGGFASPVGYGENNNTTGNSGPALRLVTKGGISADGVLSVSTLGTGNIATFGNASVFVSTLTTNGTWSALAFNPTSDRNAKENFVPVDPQEVLAKVAALPIAQWNYKAVAGVDHIGPVAQDFHAAFGLNGADNKHIATVDADGVALAAIQGLNQKVEQENAALRAENARLKSRLDRLEQLLNARK